MKREIVVEWIEKAVALSLGEKISIPCETRQEAKEAVKTFKKELKILAEIDPLKSSKLFISMRAAESVWWLTINRVQPTSLVGFVTRSDGKTERVELGDPDKSRRILLMKQDGYSVQEIEDIEGELTDEEVNMIGR